MSNIEAPGSTRIYFLIGASAVLHSALLLLPVGGFPAGLPLWFTSDRFWIALALFWFLWPVAMLLHPRRSWLRFAVPLVISLCFLVPASRFYYWIVEEELHSGPSPTRDKPIVERVEDLGAGFRRVTLAEYIEGGFESVYHGEYLFFRDRKLTYFTSASVAPSRRFAVYINPQSDRLILFRVADETTVELSQVPVTEFGGIDWDETSEKVILRYSSGRASQDFPLK